MKLFLLRNILVGMILLSFIFSEYAFAVILPSAITNGVFHFDAQDINGNGSDLDEPTNGTLISIWGDGFGSHSGNQIQSSQRPLYQTGIINNLPVARFVGGSDILEITDHTDINLDISYPEKSFAFLVRTRSDITTPQVIYEQSILSKGYSLQLDGGNLYFGAWNTDFWITPDDYKVINLGPVTTNTPYRVIVSGGSTLSGYLNGVSKDSVMNVGIQTTHGQCIFDSGFGCALYMTGGTIGVGGVHNDSIRLSTLSNISTYQSNFFQGDIGEIVSWNHTLTEGEVNGLDDYFLEHWGFDTTPPNISSVNIASGTLIPTGTFTLIKSFSDTGSSIDPSSFTGRIYGWDSVGGVWDVVNIAPAYMSITGTTTTATGQFLINNLPFGKYRFDVSIDDIYGNTKTQSFTYFVDQVEWSISSPEYSIGPTLFGDTFGTGELLITVRTVGAGFSLDMIRTNDLAYLTGSILVFDGTHGWGYDKNIGSGYASLLSSHGGIQNIVTLPKDINHNGNRNTYVYRVKYGLNPSGDDPAGDYIGNVRFDILFDF